MTASLFPYFIDTTLRDGEQSPGVVFSLSEKIRISSLLNGAGVSELELGTPAMGEKEVEDIRTIARIGFNFKTLAWCRATKNDILMAARCGTNGVHLSFPVSPVLLEAMGKDRAWVAQQLHEMIDFALPLFDYVTVGAQDASRADISYLKDFIGMADFNGASRVRIADTVGILNPLKTYKLIKDIRTVYKNIPLEIHAHNDLGMAVANTVSAYLAGAECLSVTVNGLGERAGNAALEEVAMALELSEEIDCGLKTEMFAQLSDYVAQASCRTLSESKPITGNKVLTHESGIHTNCLLKNRNTYQLFEAKRVGRTEQPFLLGKHSGRAALIYFLKEEKLPFTDDLCEKLLLNVKEKASELKRALSKDEFYRLYLEIKTIKKTPICK